jgi:dUTPase
MSNFTSNKKTPITVNNQLTPVNILLNLYPSVMHLKIFVDPNNYELKNMYTKLADKHNEKILNKENIHNIDAGVDIFTPLPINEQNEDFIRCYGIGWPDKNPVNKIDFQIKCSASIHNDNGKIYNTGYYIHPRSSLSKTKLRLANATGIIDSGYRGNIIGMFDVVNIDTNDEDSEKDADYYIEKHERLIQICGPSLMPIVIEVVDDINELGGETLRGDGGFGSTGK